MRAFRYVYSDSTQLSMENAFDVLYLARKYMLEGLVEHCTKFLFANMDVWDVSKFFEREMLFDEEFPDRCGILSGSSFAHSTLIKLL